MAPKCNRIGQNKINTGTAILNASITTIPNPK